MVAGTIVVVVQGSGSIAAGTASAVAVVPSVDGLYQLQSRGGAAALCRPCRPAEGLGRAAEPCALWCGPQ